MRNAGAVLSEGRPEVSEEEAGPGFPVQWQAQSMTQACCFGLWSGLSGLFSHERPELKVSGPKTVASVPTLGSCPGRLSPTVSQGDSPPMT